MRTIIQYLAREIEFAKRIYKIETWHVFTITAYPILSISIFSFLLLLPYSRQFAKWMLLENNPVELLTFVVFVLASLIGISFVFKMRKLNHKSIVLIFFGFFSICSFIIGMEEIAWGQWLFGFETPPNWENLNVQNETTLHNLKGLQGQSEIPQVFFGIAGLFGVWLSDKNYFPYVHVPKILIPSFIVIFTMAGFDLLVDNFQVSIFPAIDSGIMQIDELTELIIAITCYLFISLNKKMLLTSVLQHHSNLSE